MRMLLLRRGVQVIYLISCDILVSTVHRVLISIYFRIFFSRPISFCVFLYLPSFGYAIYLCYYVSATYIHSISYCWGGGMWFLSLFLWIVTTCLELVWEEMKVNKRKGDGGIKFSCLDGKIGWDILVRMDSFTLC